MTNARNTCMTCLHRHEDQCRLNPPQVTIIPIPVQTLQGPGFNFNAISGWPQAVEAHWCAQWAGQYKLAS